MHAMSPPAPTNRTGARCGSSTHGSPRPPQQILDRQPEHELDLGLDRYDTPAELLADLDVVDASLRANGSARARRRPAGPAAGSGARLRLSPVRSGHAAELRRARGGRRRAAGLGRRAPRLRVAVRARARRAAGRRTRHAASAGRRRRRTVRAGAQGTRHRAPRPPARSTVFGPRGGAQLHHLDVPVGVGHARGGDPAQGGRPARRVGPTEPYAPGRHRAAVRDHRRPAARIVDSGSGAGPSAVPGAGGRARRAARR